MKQNKTHIKNSFFLDFYFKEKSFPSFYKKITNSFLTTTVYNANTNKEFSLNNSTCTVSDIPSYLVTEFANNNNRFKLLTAQLYSGFLINLSVFKNLEDYLDNKLGKPRKSQLKRYRKRLDICIAPKYKIFYGDISKNEYNHIFKQLIILTERRFAQKEELNFELPFLELYKDMMYPLILKKKASIFVIYHDKKPINITLNFIDETSIFHWNSCYDIDYQMFNLGHINMINHLEWAFKNGFKLFDMGRGDFFHKRKYVNESYIYNEHIVYDSKSLPATVIARVKILKQKIRHSLIKLLKKINLHLWYSKYAKYKYRVAKLRNKKDNLNTIITSSNISEIPKLEKLTLLDLNKSEHAFLIKPLNYFIHKNQEFVKNVKVYADLKHDKTFYFEGLKKHQKITVEN